MRLASFENLVPVKIGNPGTFWKILNHRRFQALSYSHPDQMHFGDFVMPLDLRETMAALLGVLVTKNSTEPLSNLESGRSPIL